MKDRATRADVALRAGVSKTTVTYVLTDRYDISIPETTRKRVRAVAKELGYRPHAAAKALALGKTNAITVAVPLSIIGHYARVLQTFERHTNAHGYHLVASTIGHVSLKNVLPDLWSLLNGLTDGLILVDMPTSYKPFIDEVLPSPKPIVSMGVFTVPGLDGVEVALEKGVTAAIEHLLQANPRRLACFGSGREPAETMITWASSNDPRPLVYQRMMLESGRPLEIIPGNMGNRRESMEILRRYVSERGCPDALLCANDELAISAHRVLREMGYRIPHDVRLVGCDGSEEGEYIDPQLSTIAQPIDQMCALAWEFMANRLQNPSLPQQRATVDAELIIRGSSSL